MDETRDTTTWVLARRSGAVDGGSVGAAWELDNSANRPVGEPGASAASNIVSTAASTAGSESTACSDPATGSDRVRPAARRLSADDCRLAAADSAACALCGAPNRMYNRDIQRHRQDAVCVAARESMHIPCVFDIHTRIQLCNQTDMCDADGQQHDGVRNA